MSDIIGDKEEYLKRLINTAEKEALFNPEDNKLISTFFLNFELYNWMLEEALSDGIISVEDKAQIYKYRAKIFADNLKLIKQSGEKLTEDEKAILLEILRILNELRDKEGKFPSMA